MAVAIQQLDSKRRLVSVEDNNEISAPPHDSSAEEAIAALLLNHEEAIDKIASVLQPIDFYVPRYRVIFEAAREVKEAGDVPHLLSIQACLRKNGRDELVGGAVGLTALFDQFYPSQSVLYYAGKVLECAKDRECLKAQAQANEDIAGRVPGARETLANELKRIESRQIDYKVVNMQDLAQMQFKEYEKRYENKGEMPGVTSGYNSLDNLTGGFQKGDLIVIAARPSMGKTAFVCNLLHHAAIEKKRHACLFSLEMSKQAITDRILSHHTQLDSQKMRFGILETPEWNKLSLALGVMASAKLTILDSTDQINKVSQMDAFITGMAQRGELPDEFYLDHLSHIVSEKEEQNRTLELDRITQQVKHLAVKWQRPFTLLCQLNRGVEQRNDKRPVLSDLRESGGIEQNSDLVMVLYRDEYYNPHKQETKGEAEIIIRKQRNGPLGTVYMLFRESTGSFGENAGYVPAPPEPKPRYVGKKFKTEE